MPTGPLLVVVLEGASAGEPPRELGELPHATAELEASGAAVGLADGKPGNAESGWATLGAGRPIPPAIAAIEREAAEGKLVLRERLQTLFRAVHYLSAPGAAPSPFSGGLTPDDEEDRRSSLHVFVLLGDDTRPSRTVRRAIFDAAEQDGVRVIAHAVLDHGLSYATAARHLETLAGDLERAGRLGSLSGRRFGFDGHEDYTRAMKLFEAAVRGDEAPTEEEWLDVLGAAAAAGVRPEDIAPVRIGAYKGMRGGFSADFGEAVPAWAWRGEDAALLLGARPTDFAPFVRLLLHDDLPAEVAAGALTVRGKRVIALSHQTLATLVPVAQGRREPSEASERLESVAPAPLDRPSSLLHDLAKDARVLAIAPTSRRHGLAFLGGGSVPTNVELVLVDTDREEPELSVRALVAPARDALVELSHDVVIVSIPDLDRAAHAGDATATVAAERAIAKNVAPLISSVLAAGGRACVTSPYAASADGTSREHRGHTMSRVPLWLYGGDRGLEPSGTLADVAPTIAAWVGLPPVADATGRSLLRG